MQEEELSQEFLEEQDLQVLPAHFVADLNEEYFTGFHGIR
jgi:hypothetical protein